MTRGNRKSRRRSGQSKSVAENVIGDLTLDDFANSPTGKGRLKKAASNAIEREVRQLCSDGDSRDWYEKELDEFDFVPRDGSNEQEEDLALVRADPKPRSRSRHATEKPDPSDGEVDGRAYPLDIWFLLSEYVRPEDVCRFALICQSTLYVVNSAKFWYGMYKRYYKKVLGIPERLQPECMERPCGLRPHVVRALFYCYPPFMERLKPLTSFEAEPYLLVRSFCVMQWHQRVKDQWHFFFKLHHPLPSSLEKYSRSSSNHPHPPDLLEMLGDVNSNPEQGCKVLQVIGHDFASVPIVLGLTLASVTMGVSQGMRHHCLKLGFGPPYLRTRCTTHQTQVTLDPVLNLKVLDWWHPNYPHFVTR